MTDENKTKVKVNRGDLLQKISEIVATCSAEPAEEIITTGEALIKIGEALRGVNKAEAKSVIRATQILFDE